MKELGGKCGMGAIIGGMARGMEEGGNCGTTAPENGAAEPRPWPGGMSTP